MDIVVLADINSVSTDSLDIHSMSIRAPICYCYVTDMWSLALIAGVVWPLVGISTSAPIRHESSALGNFESSIANTFSVIHSPAINQTVLRSICPHRRITTL